MPAQLDGLVLYFPYVVKNLPLTILMAPDLHRRAFARSLLGRATPIENNRGRVLTFSSNAQLLITVHPSALLRIPDEFKREAYLRFVADLKIAARFVNP